MPGAVPESAELLVAFVNTRDIDSGEDQIATPQELSEWLSTRGLARRADRATADDVRVAAQLREALRRVFLTHHEAEPDGTDPELDGLARDLPLRVSFGPDGPRLVPVDDGVHGGLAAVLAATHQAQCSGVWTRMKACPADACHWAFYDTSKNQSRTWCSMQVCGNRAKTRSYRARHAPA